MLRCDTIIESVESRVCLKSTAIDFNSVEDIRSAKKVLFAACFEDSIRQIVWLLREGLVLFGRLEKLTTLCIYILGLLGNKPNKDTRFDVKAHCFQRVNKIVLKDRIRYRMQGNGNVCSVFFWIFSATITWCSKLYDAHLTITIRIREELLAVF